MENPILVVAYNLKEFRDYIIHLAQSDEHFTKAMALNPPKAMVGGQTYFYVSHYSDLLNFDSRCKIKFLSRGIERQDYKEILERTLARGFEFV